MSFISYNELHMVGVTTDAVNRYLKEIQTFFEEEHIPPDYSIVVHDDEVTCCGMRGLRAIAIELQGPEKQPVDGLATKIFAKIQRICEGHDSKPQRCVFLEFQHALQVHA